MAKGDIEIGSRAYEEAMRLFDSPRELEARIGISKSTVYNWQDGVSPGGLALARLHYSGADVLYILTGRRTMEVN